MARLVIITSQSREGLREVARLRQWRLLSHTIEHYDSLSSSSDGQLGEVGSIDVGRAAFVALAER